MSWNKKDNILGFTLIEVVIVLFIISVFVSFGMPKFMDMLFESDISQTVRKIAMIVKQERLNSITEKQESVVIFDKKANVVKYSNISNKQDKLKIMKLDNIKFTCSSLEESDKDSDICKINISQNGLATPCRITFFGKGKSYTITIKPFIINMDITESG